MHKNEENDNYLMPLICFLMLARFWQVKGLHKNIFFVF